MMKRVHSCIENMNGTPEEVIKRLKEENTGFVKDSPDGTLKRCLVRSNTCLRLHYQTGVTQGSIIQDLHEGDCKHDFDYDGTEEEEDIDSTVYNATSGSGMSLLVPPAKRRGGIIAPLDFLRPFTKVLFATLFDGIADEFKNFFN